MRPSAFAPQLLLFASFAASAAGQIAPGNVVVLRVGDGLAPLASSVAAAAFLDEYTPAGVLVQSIALPTAASGANRALTNSGTATSEGHLNLSADGQYLVVAGYDAAPGTTALVASTSAAIPRVIGRIDLAENIDTSTSLNNAFSANNIRSATTSNGVDFWAVGANSGVQYTTLGGSTGLALNTLAPTNNRTVTIQDGQLYCSQATGVFQGVSAVGTGLPSTAGQTIALLPGFPTASGPSAYDHFFADASTLYVADDRTNGSGGIQKWTLAAGTWTLQYTLALSATTGCRGLTGTVDAGLVTLYATATSNQLVTAVDLGAGSLVSALATGATNTALRGIRFIRTPGSIVRLPHGCGPTTIATTGTPRVGQSITTNLGGTVGAPFVGLGFGVGAIPFCGLCTVGHDWAVALFGTTSVLNVPNFPIYIGAVVGIQGADFFGVGGCPSPQLTFTDTIVVTIGS